MKCAQCDTNEAAWEWPCILVSHSQTDLGSKVQVRQSVVGLGNAGLCPACEKKMSWAMAGIQMYACFGLVGSFFLFFLVLIAGDKLKISKGIQFAVVGVLFLVSAAILLGGRFVSDRHYQNKPMKKRARLLSDCKFRYYHYVPVGDKFYSSFENFRQVNSSVLYDLAEKIYKDLIKTDKWKEMTPGKRIGFDFANTDPSNLLDALRSQSVENAVELLRQICREHPEGVDASSPEAEKIKKCGDTLNLLGKTDLMSSAYEKISGEDGESNPGFAECVNALWKDIGDWGKQEKSSQDEK